MESTTGNATEMEMGMTSTGPPWILSTKRIDGDLWGCELSYRGCSGSIILPINEPQLGKAYVAAESYFADMIGVDAHRQNLDSSHAPDSAEAQPEKEPVMDFDLEDFDYDEKLNTYVSLVGETKIYIQIIPKGWNIWAAHFDGLGQRKIHFYFTLYATRDNAIRAAIVLGKQVERLRKEFVWPGMEG